LESLHVIHCGELKHIFVLDGMYPDEIAINDVAFPKLTIIHLHDLPTLWQICEVKMVAPKLESIKIRGCWSLCRLPVVEDRGPGVKKPTIEIEKDVWDALEWDGAEASHHPSHFEAPVFEAPVHSRYYKKKLPRTSVLRYARLHTENQLRSRAPWSLILNFFEIEILKFQKNPKKSQMLAITYSMVLQNLNTKYVVIRSTQK
jgi:hypothetical protein